MTGIVLTLIGIVGGLAALWLGLPPPTPDLWPIAIGLIVAGVCALTSTLAWSYVQLKKLNYIRERYLRYEHN
jgi:hypothetical protein